ncbi:MAG: hypothetical protein ACSHWS_16185 [Sulfitobacter sp.]
MIRSNDPSSFPRPIKEALREHKDPLVSWAKREIDLCDTVDPDSIERILWENDWSEKKTYVLEELLMEELRDFDVSLLHYTRLLEHELINVQEFGMQPTSLDLLEQRLLVAVEREILTEADCSKIYEQTPLLNQEQKSARLGEVCFVSAPIQHADNGIRPLLSHWGGEMIYFWLKDDKLKKKLKSIGHPTVIETSVRLADNVHIYSYAKSILNCFLRSKMEWAENPWCELHIRRQILPSEIKRSVVEGSSEFEILAEGRWE